MVGPNDVLREWLLLSLILQAYKYEPGRDIYILDYKLFSAHTQWVKQLAWLYGGPHLPIFFGLFKNKYLSLPATSKQWGGLKPTDGIWYHLATKPLFSIFKSLYYNYDSNIINDYFNKCDYYKLLRSINGFSKWRTFVDHPTKIPDTNIVMLNVQWALARCVVIFFRFHNKLS